MRETLKEVRADLARNMERRNATEANMLVRILEVVWKDEPGGRVLASGKAAEPLFKMDRSEWDMIDFGCE